MLETSWRLEFSTSLIAVSITWICSPSCEESAVILPTFSPVKVTFSRVSWISFKVCSIEDVIFSEISSRRVKASWIWPDEDLVSVLNVRICSATTAKPFPASPARAASIEAFKASRLVWLEMLSIVPVSSFTFSNSDLNSCKTFSTSPDSSDIVPAVFTSSSRSVELVCACVTDSAVKETISLINATTCSTCALISPVISVEEVVCCCNFPLLSVNSFMLSKTTSEPCLFSEASSRTTVIPFIMVLLAVFTFSTVEMTRCKSALILSVKAPSDSFKWRIDST